MGSALYEHPRRLLVQRFRQFVLMLDGDAAGRRAEAVVLPHLSEAGSGRVVQFADNTQPDQLSEHELRDLLEQKGGQPETH